MIIRKQTSQDECFMNEQRPKLPELEDCSG